MILKMVATCISKATIATSCNLERNCRCSMNLFKILLTLIKLYCANFIMVVKMAVNSIDTKVTLSGEARWPSGRASDSGARGRVFDPHSVRRVVSLSKIHLPPKKYW